MPKKSKQQPDTSSQPSSAIIWGAKAIAKAIGLKNERAAFHKLQAGHIPGARKSGETWSLDLDAFRAAYRQPAEGAERSGAVQSAA